MTVRSLKIKKNQFPKVGMCAKISKNDPQNYYFLVLERMYMFVYLILNRHFPASGMNYGKKFRPVTGIEMSLSTVCRTFGRGWEFL